MRWSVPSSQNTSPRLTPSELTSASDVNGSKTHLRAPVAASSASTLSCGDVAYSTPWTTSGLH